MHKKLKSKFDGLENSLHSLFVYVDSLSELERYQSDHGQWNAVQILYHLYSAEKMILSYLKIKLTTPKNEVTNGGLASWIRSRLLSRALKSRTNKFQAPKRLEEPKSRPDYLKLKHNFFELRKQWPKVLEEFDANMLRKAYFNHPRAGRITIEQTLDFMQDHFERHAEQVRQRSSG